MIVKVKERRLNICMTLMGVPPPFCRLSGRGLMATSKTRCHYHKSRCNLMLETLYPEFHRMILGVMVKERRLNTKVKERRLNTKMKERRLVIYSTIVLQLGDILLT
jgi:hypothetical protein